MEQCAKKDGHIKILEDELVKCFKFIKDCNRSFVILSLYIAVFPGHEVKIYRVHEGYSFRESWRGQSIEGDTN